MLSELIRAYNFSQEVNAKFTAAVRKYSDQAEEFASRGAYAAAAECHRHIDNYLQPAIDASRTNMLRLANAMREMT